MHALPKLGPNDILGQKFQAAGVPGLMTPRAFQQIWNVYQQSLIDRLNESTAGTEYQDKPPKTIHIDLSRQPDKAAIYNAAAMAHFNHFFFESLRAEPAETNLENKEESAAEQLRGSPLLAEIETSFDGSIDNLRDAMLDHANAIFGNGFVWLVRSNPKNIAASELKVLCTYNAGSPYSEAYKMRQGTDRTAGRSPQFMAGSGKIADAAVNGLNATPLLCINVWQQNYVLDYGLSPMGKETYTKAWWQTIDWAVVKQRFDSSKRPDDYRFGR